jgi:hypothetical protein
VPVVVSEVDDNGDEHGEGLRLVGLEDVEEVVVLEEAHGTIGYLQMDTADTSNDTLEKSLDEHFNLFDFAHFQNFLQFGQEECFFNAVGEGPVLEETLKQWDS